MKHLKKTSRGYIYNQRIFWVVIAIQIIFTLIILARYGFDLSYKPYVECKGFEKCENPYYTGYCSGVFCRVECLEEWCNQEFIEPGTYGTPPPKHLLKGFVAFIISVILLAFIINHYKHNVGKPFHLEVILTPQQKRIFKKLKNEKENN